MRPGDVILYQSGKSLVAHRLIKKEQGRGQTLLITRGDAFPWRATEHIAPEQVLGRVVCIEWRRGLKVRIDQDPGRRLGIMIAGISPFLFPGGPLFLIQNQTGAYEASPSPLRRSYRLWMILG